VPTFIRHANRCIEYLYFFFIPKSKKTKKHKKVGGGEETRGEMHGDILGKALREGPQAPFHSTNKYIDIEPIL